MKFHYETLAGSLVNDVQYGWGPKDPFAELIEGQKDAQKFSLLDLESPGNSPGTSTESNPLSRAIG